MIHNAEAAEVLRQNRKTFEANVQRAMQGGSLNGVQYERVLA
jgi:ubiquitin-conjugating enzyme E2 M